MTAYSFTIFSTIPVFLQNADRNGEWIEHEFWYTKYGVWDGRDPPNSKDEKKKITKCDVKFIIHIYIIWMEWFERYAQYLYNKTDIEYFV